jgi:predicted nucleic acid-binding protein
VRALLGGDANAAAWIDRASAGSVDGLVPDLVFAEVANTFVVHVRAGALDRSQVRARMRAARALPLEVVPTAVLAESAVDVALNRELSAYDACYAALAEASEAILVTADRRLAEAVPRSALLPGAAPPA